MPRFDNDKIAYDVDIKVAIRPIRLNKNIPAGQTFQTVIEAGDSIDAIAFRIYGSSRLWWIIADLNGLIHPLYIEPGTRLKLLLPRFVGLYL